MSQALHILRKDLRRGWPLLLLWGAILCYWIAPLWSDLLYTAEFDKLGPFRSMLAALGGIVATALVIQQDSLVDAREFWMTRPIRRRSLLAAKAMLIVAFIVLPPVALQFSALVGYGLPKERWVLQLLDLSLPWAGAIALAALLASWTRGLPGFFAFLAGLLLLPSFGLGVLSLFRVPRFSVNFASGCLPAVGLVALGLLAVQYATRRRVLTAALAAVVLPAAVFLGFRFDPFDALHRAFTPRLPDVHVELTAGPGRQTFAAERPGPTAGRAVDLWSVPSLAASSGKAMELSGIDGEIAWDGGGATPFYAMGLWHLSDVPQHSVTLPWSGVELSAWRALGVRAEEPFENFLGRSGALRGKAAGAVWTLGEIKTLPLQAGLEHERGSSRIRIVAIERPPGDFRIRLRTTQLVDRRRSYSSLQLALVNQTRSETTLLRFDTGGGQFTWTGLLAVSPFMLVARESVWSPRPPWELNDNPVDMDWMNEAELMVTYYDFAGAADVWVAAPRLVVDSIESDSPGFLTMSGLPWYPQ